MNDARLIIEGRGNWVYTHGMGDAERIGLGRAADNAVRLEDLHSSSHHAEIVKDGDGYLVRDLGSRNGTYLNGAKITEGKLNNGATIKIGNTTMSFLTGEDESFFTTGSGSLLLSKASADSENALQPMKERLDELKSSLSGKRSSDGEAVLINAVEDLQRELRDAQATIRRLNLVNEFSGVLTLQQAPLQLLATALEFMGEHVQAENGFVMQVDPQTRKWAVRARYGAILDWSQTGDAEDSKQLPLSLSIVEEAIKGGKPVMSQSGFEDPRFDDAKSILNLGIRSFLCFPMKSKGKCVGVAYVDRRTNPAPFGLGEEKLFEALTDQLNRVLYPA